MKKQQESFQEPQPLNADEFMWSVVAGTPDILRQVGGVVNVDVRMTISDTGHIERVQSIACQTVVGNPVAPDQPEIVGAASKLVRMLRFAPARRAGQPVRRESFKLSFGFSTAALDLTKASAVFPLRN